MVSTSVRPRAAAEAAVSHTEMPWSLHTHRTVATLDVAGMVAESQRCGVITAWVLAMEQQTRTFSTSGPNQTVGYQVMCSMGMELSSPIRILVDTPQTVAGMAAEWLR